jgi:hypothetical protein
MSQKISQLGIENGLVRHRSVDDAICVGLAQAPDALAIDSKAK